jgi:hypothetical protein
VSTDELPRLACYCGDSMFGRLFPPIVVFVELIFIGARIDSEQIDSEQYEKAIGDPTREIALGFLMAGYGNTGTDLTRKQTS